MGALKIIQLIAAMEPLVEKLVKVLRRKRKEKAQDDSRASESTKG